MRVAFDARSLASPVLRGWDRYTIGLAQELARQGVEVVFYHRERDPLCSAHLDGMNFQPIGLADRGGIHWEQAAVPKALRRDGIDIYHAPAERGTPFRAPCPVALTIHSTTYDSYRDLVRTKKLPGTVSDYIQPPTFNLATAAGYAYLRAQWRMADHVFTPSEFSRQEILKFTGISAERVTTTPLALHSQFKRPRRSDAERAATLSRLQVKPPYLLFVGGYETHKNPAALVECLAMVRQGRPDLSLVLAGSHRCPDELVGLARRLNVEPEVRFLVNVSDELTDLYDGAALFVSLSWRETFCLPALEAMSRGVPVLASSWGATPEVVGDAGALVDPRDTYAAANAIIKLLQEPLHAQLCRAAMERAKRYSWTVTANRTLEVYQSLLNRAPRRRKAA